MYTFKCDFSFKGPQRNADELWNGGMSSFLAALLNNGQILEHPWIPIAKKGFIRIYLNCPARDALSSRHHDGGCRRALKELRPLLRRPPSFRLVGRDIEGSKDCRCRSRSHYILITNFISCQHPVRCGDCYGVVPLYRLPHPPGEKSHQSFRVWMGLYKACDELQMHCGFGEKFGLDQMCRLGSPLSRIGRQLCGRMTRKMRRPFYYYLHRHNWPNSRKCPGCGRDWILPVRHHFFDCRCDGCRLVSQSSCESEDWTR